MRAPNESVVNENTCDATFYTDTTADFNENRCILVHGVCAVCVFKCECFRCVPFRHLNSFLPVSRNRLFANPNSRQLNK